MNHGDAPIEAYRFGSAAYLTDFSTVPEESMAQLEGLDILFLDALRHHPASHAFDGGNSLKIVERLKPKRAFFTHISHDLPHEETNAALPSNVRLCARRAETGVRALGTTADMQVFRNLEEVPAQLRPHGGQRRQLRRRASRPSGGRAAHGAGAHAIGGKAVVVTFEPHPLRILRPDVAPKLLTPLPIQAEAAGADGGGRGAGAAVHSRPVHDDGA